MFDVATAQVQVHQVREETHVVPGQNGVAEGVGNEVGVGHGFGEGVRQAVKGLLGTVGVQRGVVAKTLSGTPTRSFRHATRHQPPRRHHQPPRHTT